MSPPANTPWPPARWRASPTMPRVEVVRSSFDSTLPVSSATGSFICQTLQNPLLSLNTALPSDAGAAFALPQWMRSSWRALPAICGMRTHSVALPLPAALPIVVALPLAGFHSSMRYASGAPSAAEKRMSSPLALHCAKSRKSLLSRTSSGNPSIDAEAGRFAPSGVVRMLIVPWCCHAA